MIRHYQGGVTTTDQDGNQYEWCRVAGVTNVCLVTEQTAMGVTQDTSCNDHATTVLLLLLACAVKIRTIQRVRLRIRPIKVKKPVS
jgi:hypothetical protein